MADKKSNRKNFRLTDKIAGYLSELSKRTGKSESELTSLAIFYLYEDKHKFLIAPIELGNNMWIKDELPFMEGIIEFKCDNGSMWVDVDTWEIVKTVINKKAAH